MSRMELFITVLSLMALIWLWVFAIIWGNRVGSKIARFIIWWIGILEVKKLRKDLDILIAKHEKEKDIELKKEIASLVCKRILEYEK